MRHTGLDAPIKHPATWWQTLLAEVPAERPVLYAAGSRAGLSLKALNAAAHCLAAYWMLRGLRTGEAVVLFCASDVWFPAIEMSIQLAGGLSLTFDPRQPESQLRDLVRQTEARFYYCADYRFYTQFRSWLDALTQPLHLVCNTDRGDRLQENDRLTTLEAALFVGKNWWREHLAEVETQKTAPAAGSPSLRWVETAHDRCVVRELSRGERMQWLRAQLATVRAWPARPRVLTVAQEWQSWAVGLGIYWPLRVADRLILAPPHGTTVLQQLRQQRITVLVASGVWLEEFCQLLARQFQADHPLRRRYLARAYRNDQRIRAAAQRGESAGLVAGLGRWPSRRFVFQKIKKRYLPALQVVTVDHGPWVEDLRRFFDPLGVQVLVDTGHELQSLAATRYLGVASAASSRT